MFRLDFILHWRQLTSAAQARNHLGLYRKWELPSEFILGGGESITSLTSHRSSVKTSLASQRNYGRNRTHMQLPRHSATETFLLFLVSCVTYLKPSHFHNKGVTGLIFNKTLWHTKATYGLSSEFGKRLVVQENDHVLKITTDVEGIRCNIAHAFLTPFRSCNFPNFQKLRKWKKDVSVYEIILISSFTFIETCCQWDSDLPTHSARPL